MTHRILSPSFRANAKFGEVHFIPRKMSCLSRLHHRDILIILRKAGLSGVRQELLAQKHDSMARIVGITCIFPEPGKDLAKSYRIQWRFLLEVGPVIRFPDGLRTMRQFVWKLSE